MCARNALHVLPDPPVQQVSYCTNIHPGESWQEIFSAIRQHAPVVKKRFSPDAPFPLGLRLSGRASQEMDLALAADFHGWCREEGFYVATVNGFPYGTFHHAPVKESVYLPDWRFSERLQYTRKIAELLALWLPDTMRGSVSTVPVGFRACIEKGDMVTVLKNLRAALDFMDHLAQKTGKEIVLAMEPEPGCFLETTEDVVDFFSSLPISHRQRQWLAVCYDCCHQALQFENPAASLQKLADNEIRIGHVQVSSALRLLDSNISLLKRFQEACYLHQTVGRKADGGLLRYDDLDQAIIAAPEDVEEWRVHFHVPVFMEKTGECDSTRFFLEELLPLLPAGLPLEVETYTWTILPAELKNGTVTDCLIEEIDWVAKNMEKRQ
ncbi:xylose isomerase [Desulfopila sp. IMCC35006]|uniref:metabolite traffic protein EboE n=1 Tax=Desulfopila sp. IMCC35006 TaxID=2569542 RepID=UPI0010ACD1ED|nr:metabolite traffic protein EboE [Desulfopila sp. IMCC35006]TKB28665.1 xylose isomerase [Desulfopila sp. IMCC35006]